MKNKKALQAAILLMSFVQMSTNAVSSILADISHAFPDVPTAEIQLLMTFPSIFVVLLAFMFPVLSKKISFKFLASSGLCLVSAAGLLSFTLHTSLLLLYLFAAMLGIGIGIVIPVATSMITMFFNPEEQSALIGYQTSAANLGSMLMTFIGGLLAVIAWYCTYFVYFLAIPGLIMVNIAVPLKNSSTTEKKAPLHLNAEIIGYMICAALFMLFFYVGPTNLAMLIDEKKLGTTVDIGIAATILLAGGMLAGLFFGKINEKIKWHTVTLGLLVLAAGYVILFYSTSIVSIFIGSFFIGTSNSFVLAQCMLRSANSAPDAQSKGSFMALTFASANLGTFLAPVLTYLCKFITHSEQASARIIVTAVLCCIMACIINIVRFSNTAVHAKHI